MSRRREILVPTAALVVVAVSALAATAAVVIGNDVEKLRAQRQAASDAATSVTVVADALRTQLAAAPDLASVPGQSRSLDTGQPDKTDAKALARDSGRPVLDDTAGVAVVALHDTPVAPGPAV